VGEGASWAKSPQVSDTPGGAQLGAMAAPPGSVPVQEPITTTPQVRGVDVRRPFRLTRPETIPGPGSHTGHRYPNLAQVGEAELVRQGGQPGGSSLHLDTDTAPSRERRCVYLGRSGTPLRSWAPSRRSPCPGSSAWWSVRVGRRRRRLVSWSPRDARARRLDVGPEIVVHRHHHVPTCLVDCSLTLPKVRAPGRVLLKSNG